MKSFFLALILSLMLSGCGGGGGGDDSTSALSFNPNPLAANVQEGTSATLVVQATLLHPSQINGDVYVYIEDSQSVLAAGSVDFTYISSTVFNATLHTSGTLPLGHQTGTLNVHLCKDTNCNQEYPGSPCSLPYDFNITPLPLIVTPNTSTAATIAQGGQYTGTVNVAVSGPSDAWTATSAAPWLSITNESGAGAGQFTVSYVSQNLAIGNYSANITVQSVDGQHVDVPFSIQVLPVQFSITSGIPSFAAINGADIAAQSVLFELNNNVASPWTAMSSAAWMIASPLSGTTPASITLQPNPSISNLASGSHSADLVLSSPDVPDKTVNTNLVLTKATLSAPTSSITFGGTNGRTFTDQSINVSLNTGTAKWPFVITGMPDWLSSSTLTGQVDASGTSINFAPNVENLVAGSQSAAVNITSTINSDTVTLPITVNINVDQRRILPSQWGMGFASTNGGDVLTRTLTIADNYGGSLTWSASSDAAWLSVTASGNTTSSPNLVLTADPASMEDNAISYANVTVATTTTGVQSAVIRIALWKSTTVIEVLTTLPITYSNLIADKIRPYVYVNNGGSTIDVYNAHTAQKVTTIAAVGSALGRMSVSPDGSNLYTVDTATSSLAVVDLTTLTMTDTWVLDSAASSATTVLAIRPNGVEVVLVGHNAYKQGSSLGTTYFGYHNQLVATANGRKVFAPGAAWNVDYSSMSGGVLLVSLQGFFATGVNPKDVAVSDDGARLYSASGDGIRVNWDYYPYKCAVTDPVDLSLAGVLPGGDAYPNNVELTSDGRVICGLYSSSLDFYLHSSAGALIQSYQIGYGGSLVDQQLVVTPDGMVVVALKSGSVIGFVPIGL